MLRSSRAGNISAHRPIGVGRVAVLAILFCLIGPPTKGLATALPSTIKTSSTLTAAGSPYTGGYVAVPKGVTLEIKPGVVLKLTGGLTMAGTLLAKGTTEEPIAFTSIKDDSFGGDTNKDGASTIPSPGNWGGLEFTSTADGVVEHAIVRYGGGTGLKTAVNYGFCPCADPPDLKHVEVSKSSNSGVRITEASPSIEVSAIKENGAHGITVSGGAPTISQNLIADNSQGIFQSVPLNKHGDVDINDNVVKDNNESGIWIRAPFGNTYIDSASLGDNEVVDNGAKGVIYEAMSNASETPGVAMNPIPPNITTNVLAGNAENGIWVGGSVNQSQNWEDPGYALVAFGNGISVPKGKVLALGPGVILKNEGPLNNFVSGTLDSSGTLEDPVVVTSIKDDTVAGDTNGDGGATVAAPGDWLEFRFIGGGAPSQSTISYTHFFYGGDKNHPAEGMVEVRCPCTEPPEFTNVTIGHSATAGIRSVEGSPRIEESTVFDTNTVSGNQEGINFNVPPEKHGVVDIDANTVESNDIHGIRVTAPSEDTYIDSASLGENEVIGNGERPIIYEVMPGSPSVPSSAMNPIPANITTNALSENGMNGLWLSGAVTESQVWDDAGYALVAFGNGITVLEEQTLTLKPGLVIKNELPNIFVYGNLDPQGTAEEPVVFTAIEDDTVGGDTNGDGAGTEPAPGAWGAIVFPVADGVELGHLDLRYAEAAIEVEYLVDMVVHSSDFIDNEAAFLIDETAPSHPVLSALACVPPFTSFIHSEGNWFGATGLPAPSIDVSSVLGALVPPEYAAVFAIFLLQAKGTASLHGSNDTIPWALYSCPPQKIPLLPLTPVLFSAIPEEPNYPH